jgi:hypothetical protein
MKKWIGTLKEDIRDGISIWTEQVIIALNGEVYNIYHYRLFKDDSTETINIAWANSLASAKRLINQDSNYRASDWTWEVIEE